MNIRPFEIALIGVFAVAAIIGLIFLSNYTAKNSETDKIYGESVVIWGTLDKKVMDDFLFELTQTNKSLSVVDYVQVDSRSFDNKFVNAIADGVAPDLIIMPHTNLVSLQSKLQPISFDSLPERTFKDTYIDGASIFLRSDGVYGIPFAADPLVMYWNKDIFSSGGLASPPKTWEALVSQTVKALVRKNDNLEITQSALAFGEYVNVAHAKEVLAMLFMQSGSSLVEERDATYSVTLNRETGNALSSGDAVLTFYTQFAMPNKDLYTWNRSKRLDRTEFLGGSLALYFGLGSERKSLVRENANLNFDMAPVPQGSEATILRDYATFYAFSIPRSSRNIEGAYGVANYLASPANVSVLVDVYNFAPAHRSLYGGAISDPYKSILYQSALVSRGWLDPSPNESGQIFRAMVEEVTSGRSRLKSVIMDGVQQLENLFR
ncbi:MAG: extracellular solute-binding protein [Candidatus Pacebacteria bacterium]|nr:extracellular solute-binding protein [Candidatus Paceibacterota bacterium]MCF7857298.1 extracellular solute-binding protein [Candidatus Paceibacterota bacterium]